MHFLVALLILIFGAGFGTARGQRDVSACKESIKIVKNICQRYKCTPLLC